VAAIRDERERALAAWSDAVTARNTAPHRSEPLAMAEAQAWGYLKALEWCLGGEP
jgi:hypothetical protein